jgi:PAS domain S-box-containing protein
MDALGETPLDYRDLLNSLNDGVYVVDKDRKIVYWSPAAERLTGWTVEDIRGKCCSEGILCHVDKDGRSLCGFEHCPLHRAMVTNSGSDVPIIVFAQRKGGGRIPMRVSVGPIRNAAGEVVGGIETFRDVSEEYGDAEFAKRIQAAMLRRAAPQDPRVAFQHYYLPLDVVGGDYYATVQVDADRFAFLLADVCGHGVAAALYTVYLDALWQNHRDLLAHPAATARTLSDRLADFVDDDSSFVTAIFGLIDLERMCLTLASAGGPPPLLFRQDGRCEELKGTGIPLGCIAGAGYDETTVPLRSGDRLLAFSDGVLEISDAGGQLLGVDGLRHILDEVGYPASSYLSVVEERLLTSSDRIRFNDDLTFLEACIR